MTADPRTVVVTEEFCNACGTPRVNVHHQSFPEMRISGESPDQAVDELAIRLETNLAAVSDPMHRAPVQLAIADVQAFINRDTVPQAKLSEVIDVLAVGAPDPAASPSMLAKTGTLEIRRLILPKGREIPTHHARGEITVLCLEGRIAFTASRTTREVGAGQLIVLAAGEPHSLVGLEDSTVLVTKILLGRKPEN
ncbi:MAG TPA: cupin domain-containing protein [Pirellulales bacterium]|jgi:quercetin dioxygenase-like cupin family protein|nr:cupin domain-containing protein [Pirellulales bacterium]